MILGNQTTGPLAINFDKNNTTFLAETTPDEFAFSVSSPEKLGRETITCHGLTFDTRDDHALGEDFLGEEKENDRGKIITKEAAPFDYSPESIGFRSGC